MAYVPPSPPPRPPALRVWKSKPTVRTPRQDNAAARWLAFACRRDPFFKEDVEHLLRRFADENGYSLAELALQFRQEEERAMADVKRMAEKRDAALAKAAAREERREQRKKRKRQRSLFHSTTPL
jgi:hypothetical protein